MQRLNSELEGLPIVSLQSGEVIATVKRPVFNMANLGVMAFSCDLPGSRRPVVLMNHDIRRASSDCLVIDSENELTEPGDIVRLTPHLQANFSPQNKPVYTDTGRKLGTVDDYILDFDAMRAQKLYVRSSLLRSWLGVSLAVDHSQIIDVTPKRITVRDSVVKASILPSETMPESPA